MHPLGIHKGMTVQLSMTWACLQTQPSAVTMTNVLSSMHPSIGVIFRKLNMLHQLRMLITIITARLILTCQKAARSFTSCVAPFRPPSAQSQSGQKERNCHPSNACIHLFVGCICSRSRRHMLYMSSYCSLHCARWPCHKLGTACNFSAHTKQRQTQVGDNYKANPGGGQL